MKLQLGLTAILCSISLVFVISGSDFSSSKMIELAEVIQEKNVPSFRAISRTFKDPVSRHHEVAGALVFMAARCPEKLSESMNFVLDFAPQTLETIPAIFSPCKAKIKKTVFVQDLLGDRDRLRNFITAYFHARLSRQFSNQFNDIIHQKGDLSLQDLRLCKRFLHLGEKRIVPEDILHCFNLAVSTIDHNCDSGRAKVFKQYLEIVASMPEDISDGQREVLRLWSHQPDFYFIDCDNTAFKSILGKAFSHDDLLNICVSYDVAELARRIPDASDFQKANLATVLARCCLPASFDDGQCYVVEFYKKWFDFSASNESYHESLLPFLDALMSQTFEAASSDANAFACLRQCLGIMASSLSYESNPLVKLVVASAEQNADEILSRFILGRPSVEEDLALFLRELPHDQLKVFFHLIISQDLYLLFIKAIFKNDCFDLPEESLQTIRTFIGNIDAVAHQGGDDSDDESANRSFDSVIRAINVIINTFSDSLADSTSLEWKLLVTSLNHSFYYIEKQLLNAINNESVNDADHALGLLHDALVLLKSGHLQLSLAVLPTFVSAADVLFNFILNFGPEETFHAYLELIELFGTCAHLYTQDYSAGIGISGHEYAQAEALLPRLIHNFSSLVITHPRTLYLTQGLLFSLVEGMEVNEKSVRKLMNILVPRGVNFRSCTVAHLFFPCFDNNDQPFAFNVAIERPDDAQKVAKINQVAQILEQHMRDIAIQTANAVLHYSFTNELMGYDLKLKLINSLRREFAAEVLNYSAADDLFLLTNLRSPEQLALLPRLLALGANINLRDMRGTTLLMQCAACGNVPMVQLLVQSGVNLSVVDAQDCTVVDYIAHAECPIDAKEAMLSLVLQVDRSLCNRRSVEHRMTPLMNYLMSIIEGSMRPNRRAVIETVSLFVRHGASLTIENAHHHNPIDIAYNAVRFGLDLTFVGELMTSLLYDRPEHADDAYLHRYEAMGLVAERCSSIENMTVINQVRERLSQLYVRDYTRVKRSVLEHEMSSLLAGISAELLSAQDPQRMVDINGNGFYATYDSYRQLCLRGALREVLREEVDQSAVQEIPSLARYILALLERRTSRHHQELTFSDYPRIDMITCDGFVISLDSFRELLHVTRKSKAYAALELAYSSEHELEMLCSRSGMDPDEVQETLELLRSSKVNLKTVHDLLDFLNAA